MSDPVLLIDQSHPGITLLTLNRPEQRNALNCELALAIAEAVEEAGKTPGQRVLILRGAGKAFCAGLDLKEAMDVNKAEEMAHLVGRILNAIAASPLVTIAAVHGGTVAGGAGIMSACDLAIATEDTMIGYPETRRGLVAGLVMTFLLRLLGERHTRELLLLGELIDSKRAYEIGLITRVVPEQMLLDCALKMAHSAILGAPEATAHTKRVINTMHARTVAQDIQTAMAEHMSARRNPEAMEGLKAFVEKRPPNWTSVQTAEA